MLIKCIRNHKLFIHQSKAEVLGFIHLYYFLNITYFKCPPYAAKHSRVHSIVEAMTFCRVTESMLLVTFFMFDFTEKIITLGEANFCIDGSVKKQNCRFWAEHNPQVVQLTPRSSL